MATINMENNGQKQIAGAIILVGVLIAGAVLLKGNNPSSGEKQKTLSEQVGVNKKEFKQCMDGLNLEDLAKTINDGAEKAMLGVPAQERGTPYSVIVGKNGSKAEVRGAYPKEEIIKLINEVKSGKVTTPYKGEVPPQEAGDHIWGKSNAEVFVIEYSDLECPYCKKIHSTLKEIVDESNGSIAWIYRHWVVHPNALPKAGASECVAKIKGNDAFWKYTELVFGLMDPVEPSILEQL